MGCCGSEHQPAEPLAHSQQAYYAQRSYAQPSAPEFQQQTVQQQQQPWLQQPQHGPAPPFLRTLAPSGRPWHEHVDALTAYVDGSTGLLAGSWAECLCWGVHFEHSNEWQSMPEYAHEGPVGGILEAFRASTAGRADSQQLLGAAERLEEAAHAAAEVGQPLPLIHRCAGAGAVQCVGPGGINGQALCGQAFYGQPGYAQQGFATQPGYATQQPYETPYEPHLAYGQQGGYGQPPFGQDYDGGRPTLLQQQAQNHGGGGMGAGGKMAMAAAGGVAAGVGGYYLATHLDGVGDALGGAAEFAGDAAEGAFDFAREGVEDVGEFVGDLF